MHRLLELIQHLDAMAYAFLSHFHGNRLIDRFAELQESNTTFKTAPFVVPYWYFWFRGGDERDRNERRKTILIVLGSTLLALVVTRLVASLAPFRLRPMYNPELLQRPMVMPAPTTFMNWSSFPSDHAAYLAALGFGLVLLSRRLAVPVALYLVGWICLPRMYLGIHYASDILVGALIGVAVVWFVVSSRYGRSRAAAALAFAEAKPHIFYPAAFLFVYEMSTLFWDLRSPVHGMLHLASVAGHKNLGDALILLGVLVVGAIVLVWRMRKSQRKAMPEGAIVAADVARR